MAREVVVLKWENAFGDLAEITISPKRKKSSRDVAEADECFSASATSQVLENLPPNLGTLQDIYIHISKGKVERISLETDKLEINLEGSFRKRGVQKAFDGLSVLIDDPLLKENLGCLLHDVYGLPEE